MTPKAEGVKTKVDKLTDIWIKDLSPSKNKVKFRSSGWGKWSVDYASIEKLKFKIYTEYASTNTSQCNQRNMWAWG